MTEAVERVQLGSILHYKSDGCNCNWNIVLQSTTVLPETV